MYKYLNHNVDISNLPKDGNHINFSAFTELHKKINFRGFSIKYVISGNEMYKINGNSYNVNNQEFILANASSSGEITIDNLKEVKGICITIMPDIITEALASYINPNDSFPDMLSETYFNTDMFLENKYNISNSRLGNQLIHVSKVLDKNPISNYSFDKEFYMELADRLIFDHISVVNELYQIKAVKHSTRKVLYKKLQKGKEFMDACYDQKININAAASAATLSEYHFFRLFKSAYGRSPQQYLIERRVSKALELLKSDGYSISEIAILTGFSDIHSFSKSFKKYYDKPPSQFISF